MDPEDRTDHCSWFVANTNFGASHEKISVSNNCDTFVH